MLRHHLTLQPFAQARWLLGCGGIGLSIVFVQTTQHLRLSIQQSKSCTSVLSAFTSQDVPQPAGNLVYTPTLFLVTAKGLTRTGIVRLLLHVLLLGLRSTE